MESKIKNTIKKIKTETAQRENVAPHKLSLLFTIVGRNKSEFFSDYLQEFEVNASFILSASGTASIETLSKIGIVSSDKAVIVSVIRNDALKSALHGLEEKFKTVRGGKGIAFATPMTSTIGVAVYQFLCNKEK